MKIRHSSICLVDCPQVWKLWMSTTWVRDVSLHDTLPQSSECDRPIAWLWHRVWPLDSCAGGMRLTAGKRRRILSIQLLIWELVSQSLLSLWERSPLWSRVDFGGTRSFSLRELSSLSSLVDFHPLPYIPYLTDVL